MTQIRKMVTHIYKETMMEVARFFEISIEVQYAEYTSYSTVKTSRAAIPLKPKPKSSPPDQPVL